MQRPKNFLFLVVLLSVVAVALAVAIIATRGRHQVTQTPSSTTVEVRPDISAAVSGSTTPAGTPSTAARKRAQDFNDATNRFNAPDEQPH